MKKKRIFFPSILAKQLAVIIFCSNFLVPVHAQAEIDGAVIDAMVQAAKSTVYIKATQGAAIPGKPQGIIDQNTGAILIAQPIRAFQLTEAGGGIVVDPAGLIVTNGHIIANMAIVDVTFRNGPTVSAALRNFFPDSDLAILQITPPFPLRTMTYRNSQTLKVGETVYALGSSAVLKDSLIEGKITRLGTDPNSGEISLIQVDFDVYKGDSGAPILDRQGKLVGIFVARATNVAQISFAIPADVIKLRYREALRSGPAKSPVK